MYLDFKQSMRELIIAIVLMGSLVPCTLMRAMDGDEQDKQDVEEAMRSLEELESCMKAMRKVQLVSALRQSDEQEQLHARLQEEIIKNRGYDLDMHMIQACFEEGADPDLVVTLEVMFCPPESNNLLGYVIRRGNEVGLKAVLKAGANPDLCIKSGCGNEHYFVDRYSSDLAAERWNEMSESISERKGTPLYQAIYTLGTNFDYNRDFMVCAVKQLLDAGANPNDDDVYRGINKLNNSKAYSSVSKDVIQVLLEYGACPDHLLEACFFGGNERGSVGCSRGIFGQDAAGILKLLLEAGAEPSRPLGGMKGFSILDEMIQEEVAQQMAQQQARLDEYLLTGPLSIQPLCFIFDQYAVFEQDEVKKRAQAELSWKSLQVKLPMRVQAQQELRQRNEARMSALAERRAELRAVQVRKAIERAERGTVESVAMRCKKWFRHMRMRFQKKPA